MHPFEKGYGDHFSNINLSPPVIVLYVRLGTFEVDIEKSRGQHFCGVNIDGVQY